MRPLFFEFPADTNSADIDDVFLFGRDFLGRGLFSGCFLDGRRFFGRSFFRRSSSSYLNIKA